MHPHPVSSPDGHHANRVASDSIAESEFLRGHLWAVDLFNFGFYWEAHEVWESLWIALGRSGPEAEMAKALIKLAAAGVKAREARSEGVRRHARRAAQLFTALETHYADRGRKDFGLSCAWLKEQSLKVCKQADQLIDSTPCPVKVVLPFKLHPCLEAGAGG